MTVARRRHEHLALAPAARTGRKSRHAMGKDRLFLASCRYCRIPVTVAPRFGPEELETLLAHVRSCNPVTRLPETPGVEAVLKHFDVRRTGEQE
jgi:hypothetical protein